MARDTTVKRLERTNKHQIYRTSDGKRVPGGSTLAKVLSFGNPDLLLNWAVRCSEEGKNHEDVRKESAELGTCFHRVVECTYKGERFPSELYPPIFVEQAHRMAVSFFEQLDHLGLDIVGSEHQIVSDTHRFGGTIDLELAPRGSQDATILGDLKSSNFVGGDHVMQVGGFYNLLFEEHFGRAPEQVILFRADRDSGRCQVKPIPPEMVAEAKRLAPIVRDIYDARKIIDRRF